MKVFPRSLLVFLIVLLQPLPSLGDRKEAPWWEVALHGSLAGVWVAGIVALVRTEGSACEAELHASLEVALAA